ncbi:hypothetical protein D7Y27_40615 [Corallococcus sp. AB004]|nr:hypothetical protein D7Y27_40615 [Corallococcus sp. AB004]
MGSVFLVLLGMAIPGAASAVPPARDGLEIKRFKASETTGAMFILRATGCHKAGDTCQLELEVSDGAGEKRKAKLPVGMAYGLKHDPDEPDSTDIWSSGDEEHEVSTWVDPVRLEATGWGLLVTQQSGFEHLHRHHRLYVLKDGGVAEAWNGDENSAGPEGSKVAPYPLTPGSPVEGFFREYVLLSAEPDQWKLDAYRWDAAGHKVVKELRNRPAYYAAIIGSFKTVQEAIASRDAAKLEKDCTRNFLILETTPHKRLTPGLFIVTSIHPEKKAAEAELKTVTACNPKVSGYVKAL